uniref:Ribosomal protein eL8/eL30/eS12/Gadd45 domain-containing protein n=1 Tax=Rhodosorus marinus TaxID=101924 RepID=A0A7S2ZFJ3_9RHOD|mmetsp:Transcript_17879/g.71747  ORF Transcript_17879/g.71747 Transcript_17879/m.71747 type:complete len:155 (+) Transcript_17879:346-810(+)
MMDARRKRRNSAVSEQSSGKKKRLKWSTGDMLRSGYYPRVPSGDPGVVGDVLTIIREHWARSRGDFIIGLNHVTRALERGSVKLVVLCRLVQPIHLIEHLPSLCSENKAHLVVLASNGHDLASIFKQKRTTSIALKSYPSELFQYRSTVGQRVS